MTLRKLLSCLLLAAAPASALAQTTTGYFAVFLKDQKPPRGQKPRPRQKLGHLVRTHQVAGDKVTTTTSIVWTLARLGAPLTFRSTETHVETKAGRPLSFASVQAFGDVVTRNKGTLRPGGKMTVISTIAGRTTTRAFNYPAGAMMSEGMELLARQKGLRKGTTYALTMFDASTLKGLPVTVRVGGRRDVDLLGRVVSLTEVITTIKIGDVTMRTTSYADDDHQAQKLLLPMAGIILECVACTRQVALSRSAPAEFFDRMLVASPKPLGDLSTVKSAVYRLQPASGARLRLPTTEHQSVKVRDDGQFTVIVRAPVLPKAAAFPYRGRDKALLAAMGPTSYLQSKDEKIILLARKAVGPTTDAADAVARIEKFVSRYITTKDLSVGYASASEVAASRQGDCSEHAVLAAALCRAVGIPAKVVVGVAYVPRFKGRKDIFGPHAWTRARVGGKWIDFDAALGAFTPGHLALGEGNGDPMDFFNVVNTLGAFRITTVKVVR